MESQFKTGDIVHHKSNTYQKLVVTRVSTTPEGEVFLHVEWIDSAGNPRAISSLSFGFEQHKD